jgi:hypothetical protein
MRRLNWDRADQTKRTRITSKDEAEERKHAANWLERHDRRQYRRRGKPTPRQRRISPP